MANDLTIEAQSETIPQGFLKTVSAHGSTTALRWMNEDESWGSWTFDEYAAEVAIAAGRLRALGVSPGDRVVLMLRNVKEFHVVDLATLFLGATPVSIYNSSSSDQIAYLVGHCGAKVGIVEGAMFADRFAPVRDALPDLETLVSVAPADGCDLWGELAGDPVDLDAETGNATAESLATIIYTSGTTGNPKGVMLDHRNICWTLPSLRATFPFDDTVGIRVVSYLPMAHIAERAVSHYGGIFEGYEVTCCPDPSKIADYAREVHPNLIFGVPRVWEKIYATVSAVLAADPEKAKMLADGVEAAIPLVEKIDWGTATDEDRATYQFLDDAAFSTLRGLIGLDEVQLAVTGAAPIPAELLSWYRAIGVNLCEIYGMSESSGPMTFTATHIKAGTVGPVIPGAELMLGDDGEVLFRGPNVFKGYLNEPEKTAEALDEDGWLHSGDIGEIDDDGYLRIVDRKKELIITAGGKNISPANLEAALKTIPLVGQACAVGDRKPFVAALVVLDNEYAPVWAAQNGLGDLTLQELACHPRVREEIDAGLEEAMSDFNNAERVKKVTILAEEWPADSELLTPTSKLKRRGIHAKFAEDIDAFYA